MKEKTHNFINVVLILSGAGIVSIILLSLITFIAATLFSYEGVEGIKILLNPMRW
jgi:hypothetical protein